MHFSVSQIKTFMKSKSERAGRYILKIEDDFKNDSFVVWRAIHKYFENMSKDEAYNILTEAEDKEMALTQFDILIWNLHEFLWGEEWLKKLISETQAEAFFKTDWFLWYPMCWYIDKLWVDTLYDLKSVSSLSTEYDAIPIRAGMSTRDEYELQAWIYMKQTNRNKCIFIEIPKKDTSVPLNTTSKKDDIIKLCKWFNPEDVSLTTKQIVEKYHPKRDVGQNVEVIMTEEFDRKMTEKYTPILQEMFWLIIKHRQMPVLDLDK